MVMSDSTEDTSSRHLMTYNIATSKLTKLTETKQAFWRISAPINKGHVGCIHSQEDSIAIYDGHTGELVQKIEKVTKHGIFKDYIEPVVTSFNFSPRLIVVGISQKKTSIKNPIVIFDRITSLPIQIIELAHHFGSMY